MPSLLMKDFKDGATDRTLFSREPRLSIRQAFHAITQKLPENATVIFDPYQKSVVPDIFPYSGPEEALDDRVEEPTHLSYQFFSQFHSLLLWRIRVREERQRGTGSALIASQLPFWQQLGVTAVAVKAHGLSEGFYAKLGFRRADALPECPGLDGKILTLMRLDLTDPTQNADFRRAISKTKPLAPGF